MVLVSYIGLAISVIGGIGLLLAAFRTHVFWGIACIFIPPAAIIYTVLHWDEAKNPFLLQLVGLGILLLGSY